LAKRILEELALHAPFTGIGALTGIIIMLAITLGGFLPQVAPVSQNVFYVLHPTHVFLSAVVTTAMYMRYGKRKPWLAILIGFTGAIGIATLSDSVIPYLGEALLGLPNRGIHVGFIEKPWLTNPAAAIGIVLGYYQWTAKSITKFPHFGHVLISTWASLFHVIMALGSSLSWLQMAIVLGFLFLSVWIPCCTSDIIYPMLFSRRRGDSDTPLTHDL
jgi:hypothetical protein